MKKLLTFIMSILMLFTLCFTGCSSNSKDLSLGDFIDNLKSGNIDKAKTLVIKSESDNEFKLYSTSCLPNDLKEEYYKNIKFDVVQMDKTETSATAKVKFTYPDLDNITKSSFNEVFGKNDVTSLKDVQKQFTDKITKALNSDSFPKLDKEITVEFEKGTKNWLIKDSADLNSIFSTPVNETDVVVSQSNSTVVKITEIKNLDTDFIKENSTSEDGSYYDYLSGVKPYLLKIAKKDKITFTGYEVNGTNLSVNISFITPNIPQFIEDNSPELHSDFSKETVTETNCDQVSYKVLLRELEKYNCDTIENTAVMTSEYNPKNNSIHLRDESGNIAKYIFGNMERLDYPSI